MAQATVKTVQYLDPRIEPQPDPVYEYVIGPTQNQYYQIPASGLSDTSISFNNLTTLGVDRAYLDTMELEITAQITFHVGGQASGAGDDPKDRELLDINTWTFDSFPFNKCCDTARININGGAFFSQPMMYIRAKERYMNQWELSKCYENVCPYNRPMLQYESGTDYWPAGHEETATDTTARFVNNAIKETLPTRYACGRQGCMQSAQGWDGGFNNSIVIPGKKLANEPGYENYHFGKNIADNSIDYNTIIANVRWREPIFCSPFSSRYDATYGRPLYNITSMDLNFTMQNLGNMIRIKNWGANAGNDVLNNGVDATLFVKDYNVHFTSMKLTYQVMTIPPVLNKPLTTLVPYRRFVPYLTEFNNNGVSSEAVSIDQNGTMLSTATSPVEITSGVYTFNEVPTAVWIFVAPTKDLIMGNNESQASKSAPSAGTITNFNHNWDSNKMFAYIRKVNLSLANTTQILDTAKVEDLYRIAKANGCEDSYINWSGYPRLMCNPRFMDFDLDRHSSFDSACYQQTGSVLRVKPGVDLVVPDQPLIPGANANNMVFQARVTVDIPPHDVNQNKYALWLLFEYVGVAAISPGQCEISMNPLGSGEIMSVSPVMSATSDSTEGQLEGSGFWDTVKKNARIAGQIANEGILSKILRQIPHAEKAADWAESHGLGEPAKKRGKSGGVSGGAVIGRGLNEWV